MVSLKKEKSEENNFIYKYVERLLGVDTRALGVFRISLGFLIIYDLVVRSCYLIAHYSDQGLISRSVLQGISENPIILSIHMVDGGVWWGVSLMVLSICMAFAFTIGFYTRIASVFLWAIMLSWHSRNPFVNNLGDWFLLDLLLWSALLPLGASWSYDVFMGRVEKRKGMLLSLATMGITFQILSIYVFSTFYKISPLWHSEGSAIFYALSLDRLVTPLGGILLGLPEVWLRGLTFAVLALEKWGWILVMLPVFNGWFRVFGVLLYMSFHAGLAGAMNLGIFPFICIMAWLLLLPTAFWDKAEIVLHGILDKVTRLDLPSLKIWRRGRVKENLENYQATWLEMLFSLILILSVLSSNLLHSGNMSLGYYEGFYKFTEPLINSVNLRQRWNMFSPHPSKVDGWFVIVGETKDGRLVDVIAKESIVDWGRPTYIAATYQNQRWRKYYEWIMIRWDIHTKLLGDYLVRKWNHPSGMESQHLKRIRVYFMEELTVPKNEQTKVNRKLLYDSGGGF